MTCLDVSGPVCFNQNKKFTLVLSLLIRLHYDRERYTLYLCYRDVA